MDVWRLIPRDDNLLHDREARRVPRVHGHEIHNALFPLHAGRLLNYVLCSVAEAAPLRKLAREPRVGVCVLNDLCDRERILARPRKVECV